MAGVAPQFIPRELLIHTPDGKTRTLQLDRDRFTLGRSSANELCYSEDAGLSRQHMVLDSLGISLKAKHVAMKKNERGHEPQWLLKPKQKIDWALKLLHDKGSRIKEASPDTSGQPRFDVDGRVLNVGEIYRLVSALPEWNDRLGLGTARLRPVKNS
jgi:hypothetical protein